MAKIAAYGTKLRRAGVDVAALSSLSGPNLQAATIDATTHDSPSALREFVSGLIDAGEISGELVFDPNVATHIAMWNDLIARAAVAYTIVFPAGFTPLETVTFNAFVTGLGPIQAQPDGMVTAPFTLKVSGLPTWS